MNKMPINKKEKLVYTFLMVTFMAIIMTTYYVVIAEGFSVESLKNAWLAFPLMFCVAFLCEWFIVANIAMGISYKVLKENDPLMKKILITAFLFVSGMVILMSFFGTAIFNGFTSDFFMLWIQAIPKNFALAFPLQVVLAGPFIGFVFRKLFPVGTIVHSVD